MMEYQLILVAGLTLLSIAIFKAYRMIDGSSWPKTDGEIVKSTTWIGVRRTVWPDIQYRYQVDGNEYTGSTISLGGLLGSFGHYEWVYDLIKEYPVGVRVTVFYNPRKPKASCLRKDGWPIIYVLFFAGLFFSYAGYYNLWR